MQAILCLHATFHSIRDTDMQMAFKELFREYMLLKLPLSNENNDEGSHVNKTQVFSISETKVDKLK